MKNSVQNYRHYFIFGMIVMVLGIVFTSSFGIEMLTLGSGLIAFGVLVMVIGLKQKLDHSEYRNHLRDHLF